MKIIYITTTYPFGNGESFLIPEIEAFEKQGVDVCIVPIYPRGKLRDDWKNISSNYKLLSKKLISSRIIYYFVYFILLRPVTFYKHIKLLKGSTFSKLLKNLAVFPKSIWLKTLIEKEKPDHIHVHWGGTTSTAVMLATYDMSFPWSVTCHRWDIYENNLLAKKSKQSKFIRFISEKGRNDAIKYGVLPEKSIVIPLGTKIPENPKFPAWKNDGAEFLIICPANLIPVKGHVYLIEAINNLVKQKYNIRLLLAGEGCLREELSKQVHEYGLENMVFFLGHLPHDNLLQLYDEAKVTLMVLPSVDLGNGEHEGVPVSLMEAMSYGVPVLSTKTGSINELLPEKFELTVPNKNSEAIAKWIENVYNHPEKYHEKALICRNIIEKHWDVSDSVKKLINKFEMSLN